MSKAIKCRCGQKKMKGICDKCSRIKMVILLKHGYTVYKENGYNPVRYNYVKTNRQPDARIFKDMVRRLILDENMLTAAINKIHFYDNINNTLIEEFN